MCIIRLYPHYKKLTCNVEVRIKRNHYIVHIYTHQWTPRVILMQSYKPGFPLWITVTFTFSRTETCSPYLPGIPKLGENILLFYSRTFMRKTSSKRFIGLGRWWWKFKIWQKNDKFLCLFATITWATVKEAWLGGSEWDEDLCFTLYRCGRIFLIQEKLHDYGMPLCWWLYGCKMDMSFSIY